MKKRNNYKDVLKEFSHKDRRLFLSMRTPAEVQNFLNKIPQNFERGRETCKSPLRVVETKSAHCMEGAMLAVYILGLHGTEGKLVHLKAKRPDYDHVIVVFEQQGYFGALSKTNHGVLRYREPIYESVRELVLSYFHEYFLNTTGKKTLVSYSTPLSLKKFGTDWITAEGDLWQIDKALDTLRHMSIVPKHMKSRLRSAEPIERKMGEITEWKK